MQCIQLALLTVSSLVQCNGTLSLHMVSHVVQCIGINLHVLSQVVQCNKIALFFALLIVIRLVQCFVIALHMITINLKCIGIILLIISIVVQCIAYRNKIFPMH